MVKSKLRESGKIWNINRNKKDVYYIVESKNWAVTEVVNDIMPHLSNRSIEVINDDRYRYILGNSIIHFGSLNVFLNYKYNITQKILQRGKRIIVTCFHIVDSDPRKYLLKQKDWYVEKWHTSCEITRTKLIALGIPENKIVVIPIGVEERNYAPVEICDKVKMRCAEGIDDKAIVIGYFQKDGEGWGEGNQPKLIKGPDIFCDVVEKLSREYKIHVILSGPARGYVKNRLSKANIPFTHHLFENAAGVADLYKMIDIYMVTSREEGGPRAILESMASGVPIISTRVGEAPDIIQNNENGILVDIENEAALIASFRKIVENTEFKKRLIENGLKTANKYSTEKLAKQYEDLLYDA